MEVARKISNIPSSFRNCVVSIGVFDGVHLGHQRIIDVLKTQSTVLSVSSLIITFDPHPKEILSLKDKFFYLTSIEKKLNLFKKYGIDKCLILEATKKIFNIRADEFVKDILYEKLRIRQVVVGKNFKFGKNGKGDINLLNKLGKKYFFTVIPVSLREIGSNTISSSLIRRLVKKGDFRKVSKTLSRNFSISGECQNIKNFYKETGLFFYSFKTNQLFFTKPGIYNIRVRSGKKYLKGLLSVKLNEFVVKNSKVCFKDFHINNIVTFRKLDYNLVEIEILNFMQDKFEFKNKKQIKQKLIG